MIEETREEEPGEVVRGTRDNVLEVVEAAAVVGVAAVEEVSIPVLEVAPWASLEAGLD